MDGTEDRLRELLADTLTEADIWALLPDPEEQTATLNRLLAHIAADR